MKCQNNFRIVLLLSGGIDSSTMALLLSNEGFDVFPLYVDYGHKAALQESHACLEICNFLELRKPKSVKIRSLGRISKNLLTSKSGSPFFPFRNLILASIGALYANEMNCNAIAIGIIGGGSITFPDCTEEFIKALSQVLELSIDKSILVYAPFLDFDKAEVMNYGFHHNFPYRLTYSCFWGEPEHCGQCNSCLSRKQAFKVLDKNDKTRYI